MLAVQVKTDDFDRKIRKLVEIPEALQRTVIFSLNDTVDDVHRSQVTEVERVFNNPTPFMKKGLLKRYAAGRPRSGFMEPGVNVAGTYWDEWKGQISPAKVITPHIVGGRRRHKPNERGFGTGPSYMVMAKDFPRNQYGNITGGRYTQMLSDVGALSEGSANFKKARKRNRYFILYEKGGVVPIGVAERMGKNSIRMALVLVSSTNYKKRYKYKEIGRKQVAHSLPQHFNRIINKEIGKLFS